jgi:hypothetical protein
MSYDLYFIKKKDLNSENVYDILETTELKPDNEIYISKDYMKTLIEELKMEGLEFEVFEGKDEDHFELNFPTYQLSIFNSHITISLPYWDQNSNDGINKEIKLLTNVLLKNDLTGFDPQTEDFITELYEIQGAFSETKTVVDSSLKSEPQKSNYDNLMYIGIGFVIMIVVILIWRKIKK